MKNARIAWDDNNADELGHRIYRSLSPMDTANMPPALAELGPDVTEWTDTDTPQDVDVYYRVSAFTDTEEVFSEEVLVNTYVPAPVEFVGAAFSGYFNGVTSVSAMAPPGTQVGDLIVGIVGHRSALTGEVADWAVEATNIEATGLQQQSVMTRYADRAGEHQVGVAQVASERLWLGVLIFRAEGRTVTVGAIQTGLSTPTHGAGANVFPVLPVINLPGSDAPFVVSAVSSKLALTEPGTVVRPIAEAFRVLATGSDSATDQARFAVGVIQRPPSDALGVAFEMNTFANPPPDTVVGHTFEVV